jgi:hypothetical protein
MISFNHKCIFIHIPKTGGSSIEELIWPERHSWDYPKKKNHLFHGLTTEFANLWQTGALQHLFAKNVKKVIRKGLFDKYFKFTMVRNPFDKVVSQYSYMLKKRRRLRDYIGMKDDDDFKTYLSLIQKKDHVQWEPQWKFFLDDNDECLVDVIYRFENFEESVKSIIKTLNGIFLRKVDEKHKQSKRDGKMLNERIGFTEATEVPHINFSKRTHYADYYDDESREIVTELYKKDLEILSYSFEKGSLI